ncbi:porin family protein [Amphritea sp.]|uniref:porin family protein n=1 Tax=Amphritea sp. TaxID=1872502 RepID=UPI003D0D8403
MKKSLIVASVVAFSLVSANTFAADAGAYVGASLGKTSSSAFDDFETLPGVSVDDNDTGYKIFAGYKFNTNFSVEGSYTDLGEISATDGIDKVSASVDTFGVAAVGTLPVNESFGVFAKVGYQAWNVDLKATGMSTQSDDGSDVFYGVGAAYNMEAISIRGEFERYDIDGENFDMLSLGIAYNF